MSEPLDLLFIDLADPLYEGECALRYEVLRKPLGYTPADVAFPFEDTSLHLVAATPDGVVKGCVLFHPDGAGGGRLFQMAVASDLQGTGIGRALVGHLEAELRDRGLREVVLHARDHAIGFYARLGYAPFGEPYEEVGIPHRNMRKTL